MNKLILKKIKLFFTLLLLILTSIAIWKKNSVISYIDKEIFIPFFYKTGIITKNIIVIGNKYFSSSNIHTIFEKDINKPILYIDLHKKLEYLSKIPWIKHLSIQRIFPNTILINIDERIPIAIWQTNHNLYLIDSEGVKLCKTKSNKNYVSLIGANANLEAKELIYCLRKYDIKDISHAYFVGKRRWDIITNDVTLKLPEENIDEAIKIYKNLLMEGIITPDVSIIDLRLKNKIIVRKKKIVNKMTAL